ncbi:MAG TPA: TetR/AcrR family transcriptional regulator [Gryllotalpicola sp.]
MAAPATTFARARSEEQREARRTAILAAAAELLAGGTRVAELSLNELARHVGLAKSNVLRYFETREAVLLTLLDEQYAAWLDAIEAEVEVEAGPARVDASEPVERIAELVSRTIAERPVLSELLANAATVLEHNVSAEIAADYKHRAVAQATRLVHLIERAVGTLPEASELALAGAINLVIGGAWGMCRPSPGMAAAYTKYPELQVMQLDYRVSVRELIATVLTGLLARRPSTVQADPGPVRSGSAALAAHDS